MKRSISIIILVLAFASSASAMVLAGILSKATGVTYAPNAPTISASSAGATSNSITWSYGANDGTHSPGTSIKLYRGTAASGESGTPVATGITASPYSDTGLTTGQIYYYYAKANNAGGDSSQSNEVNATPVALPSVLAQYKFNGNVTDTSGNGYNVSSVGTAPTWTTGQDSVASHAVIPVNDTSTSNYIGDGNTTPVYNQFYGTTAFTVTAWVKTADAGGSQSGVILGMGGSTNGSPNWYFQIYGHTGAAPDQIGIRQESSGGNKFCVTSGAAVSNNAWHHLAFVVTTGSTGKIYLDGSEVTARTGSYNDTFPSVTADVASRYVTIGGIRLTSGSFQKANPFLGSIDDVRVYSSALSAGQISVIYAAGAQ